MVPVLARLALLWRATGQYRLAVTAWDARP
mgnify:CR=1 FL=1